jgi:NADPH2:quinone reductase
MRSLAVRFAAQGSPEVLALEEVEVAPPAAGQITLRHQAIGVNFIDTYHRGGLYPVALPSGLGVEACGVVEVVGEDAPFAVGDVVGYASGPIGAYAELRTIDARHAVRVPPGVDPALVAGVLLKGMTAEMLARRCHVARAGEVALVHAAAGGVGLLLTQWLASLGVVVIGTVGSAAKVEIARAHGCAHVILYREEDVPARVRAVTDGRGCDVVYDGVGKDTIEGSLASLRPRGLLVSFGNASGRPPPLDLLVLAQKGSLYVTRPTLFTYVAARDELVASADALFAEILAGRMKVEPPRRVPLASAADAHRELEARTTTGSTVLIP